jgi:hypothetical protein
MRKFKHPFDALIIGNIKVNAIINLLAYARIILVNKAFYFRVLFRFLLGLNNKRQQNKEYTKDVFHANECRENNNYELRIKNYELKISPTRNS